MYTYKNRPIEMQTIIGEKAYIEINPLTDESDERAFAEFEPTIILVSLSELTNA